MCVIISLHFYKLRLVVSLEVDGKVDLTRFTSQCEHKYSHLVQANNSPLLFSLVVHVFSSLCVYNKCSHI
jgi:hypothetical protein